MSIKFTNIGSSWCTCQWMRIYRCRAVTHCDVWGRYHLSEEPRGVKSRNTAIKHHREMNWVLNRQHFRTNSRSTLFNPFYSLHLSHFRGRCYSSGSSSPSRPWDERRDGDVFAVWIVCGAKQRFRLGCSAAVTPGGWTTRNVALSSRNQEDGRGSYDASMWWASWWVGNADRRCLFQGCDPAVACHVLVLS